MKRTLTLATMITLGAAAWMPLPSMAQIGLNLVINSAPPAPRFETVPAARHGHVWAPGYWNWDGRRHAWLAGHWENARDGYRYQGSEWQRDGDGYRLRAGSWQPVATPVRYNDIRMAPPAPRYERIPRSRDSHVWQPGFWDWRGNRYEWRSGIWVAERPGYVYSQPNWQQRDGRWFMEPSRWTPRGGRGRDRDHDGVPDRLEHNGHRDQDRDGDGVRNHRDDRPDNPRRN